jgi:hypothetical protein
VPTARALFARLPFLDLALLIALVAGSSVLALIAAGTARTARADLGPNEADYIGGGFRPGKWEIEGCTRFHWTTPSAWLRLPLRVQGDGFALRARVRRHMVEPAQVTLRAEGRAFASFTIASDTEIAYRILDFPLPALEGRHPFALTIDSAAVGPPLGMAIDWIEIERRGTGRFVPPMRTLGLLMLIVVIAYAVPRVTGLARLGSTAHASAMGLAIAVGLHLDVIATERIVRTGALPYAVAALVGLGVCAWIRRSLAVPRDITGWLALVLLIALGLRLALLLDPRYFYPDVGLHSLVAYQLSKEGLVEFLAHYEEIQYRFSLGLQFQAGHTYAFPYAPGFYILCWPLIRWADLSPEVAVSAAAASVNALELLLTFALARILLKSERSALVAAIVHAALPLFLIRLSLAYFPSLVGHAVDACAAAFLLLRLPRLTARAAAAIVGLMTLSLLLYSQALINFGLLFALYLLSDVVVARQSADRRRQLLVAAAGLIAVALSMGLFYGRYVGPFLAMRHGVPMPQEEVLLEQQRIRRTYAEARGEAPVVQPEDDAFAGSTFDPLRGLKKIVVRLFIFYGPFALTALWGLATVIRSMEGTQRRYLVAWSSLFFVTAFLSGALPSPNFLRYGKDLESVAPLFCLGLAAATLALARRSKVLAILHLTAFIAFGLWLGLEKWLSTMNCAAEGR